MHRPRPHQSSLFAEAANCCAALGPLVTVLKITALCAAFAGAAQRPNILFIFSDDHACRALSAYDSQLIETPNIDRLANEGVRFDRCYVTNSICGPSRACILTGKYSHKNGYYTNDEEFDGSQPTFPKLLQSAGYQTALIGKWHLGVESMPTGFDHWEILQHQGYYYQPKFITDRGQRQYVGYTTQLLTDLTLQWLRDQRDRSRPFLLMMQHKAPHRPWDPAPDRLNDFTDREFPEPPNLFDNYANRASPARAADMRIADEMSIRGPDLKAWDRDATNGARDWFYNKMTTEQYRAWKSAYEAKNRKFYAGDLQGKALIRWKYQRYLQDYLSCVASVDDSVGAVLERLDEYDLAKNTVVIYSSDQGFFLGEHGWFDKRFMYEESLRTPLLVRWPGVTKPATADDRIVSNLDFAETFLDIAGVEIPNDMQGRSLKPLLAGDSPEWRDDFYYHYYEGGGHNVAEHYGVTTGRHKLIHYYRSDQWELFDLEHDPHEMQSVYGRTDYGAVQADMTARLARLRRELEAPDDHSPR